MSGFAYPQPIFISPIYNPAFYLSLDASGYLTYDYAQTLYLGKNDYRLTYITGITPGIATPGVALVIGSDGGLTGLGAVSCSSLMVNGVAVVALPEYLNSITPGNAASSKALVLDSSGAIGTIASLTATSITETLQTAAQSNITSVGALTALTIGGNLSFTGASRSLTGLASLTATTLTGALQTAAQTNITSLGTLTGLTIDGNLSFNGAARSLTGLASLSATTLTGALQTAAQTNITSLGTLIALTIDGNLSFTGAARSMTGLAALTATAITGTLQTAAQTNITSVGTLSSLTLATGGTGIQIPSLKFWDGVSSYLTFNQGYYLSITEGSVDASKALVCNSTKDLNGLRNLTISGTLTASTALATPSITTDTITKSGTLLINPTTLNLNPTTLSLRGSTISASAAQLNYTTISTPGTAEASKVLVLESSSNIVGIQTLRLKNLVAYQPTETPLTTTSVATSYNMLVYDDSDTTATNSSIAFVNDSYGILSAFVPSARIYSARDGGAVGASDLIFGTKSGNGTMSPIADHMCIKSGAIGQTCIGSNFNTTTSMLNIAGSSSLIYGSWEHVQEWCNDQSTPMRVGLIIYNEAGNSNSSATGASFGTYTNDQISFMVNRSNKMCLNTSGRLGIGNTSPEAALHVSGGIVSTDQMYQKSAVNGASYRFNWSGVGYGAIGWDNANGQRIRLGISNADGTWSGYPNSVYGGPYANGSDRRLKQNITDCAYGLKVVMKLQPRRFQWITGNDGTYSLGFIAQEVKPLVPEVVSGDESCPKDANGMIAYPMGIEMSALLPVLCKAIQEQQAQMDILSTTIAVIKNTLDLI